MQLKNPLFLFLVSGFKHSKTNWVVTTEKIVICDVKVDHEHQLTAEAYCRTFAEFGNRGQNNTSLPPVVVG
jgi:hypothetical protein